MRESVSRGMRQVRGASFGSGAVEPGLRPSTSHQPSGICAVRVLPGSSLPMTSSLLS
jgi:hypothetical protein